MNNTHATLSVDLGDRSYPIYIGENLLDQPELLLPHIPGKQVLIVTNTTVAPLYLERVRASLSGLTVEEIILPDGEQYKNFDSWRSILDALMAARFDRGCTVVALGGGVIGDLAGFAAASYQRGVHFIQIPTTLLAQVDSSVGGKTGINHPGGKNMVGAFYQPRCVLADTATLNTLEDNQLSAGIAEVVKYGLIRDRAFFDWLNEHIEKLRERDPASLRYAIQRSCENKAEVVAADERESGQRALLNLGHTFGHAIENSQGYGAWLHGEAVNAGMSMAADMSVRLGELKPDACEAIDALLRRTGCPIDSPVGMTIDDYRSVMAVDKKVIGGRVRLVLMRDIGDAYVTGDYPDEALTETLRARVR